jgi:hypothetical protein
VLAAYARLCERTGGSGAWHGDYAEPVWSAAPPPCRSAHAPINDGWSSRMERWAGTALMPLTGRPDDRICRIECGQCVRVFQTGCWGSSLCTMMST